MLAKFFSAFAKLSITTCIVDAVVTAMAEAEFIYCNHGGQDGEGELHYGVERRRLSGDSGETRATLLNETADQYLPRHRESVLR